jgi:hypothetical protein
MSPGTATVAKGAIVVAVREGDDVPHAVEFRRRIHLGIHRAPRSRASEVYD